MAIRTIVVGVDLGESGRRAMQLAIPTAQATRATLWLVHASEVGLEHTWRDLPIAARSAAQALRERFKGRFENSLRELEGERKRLALPLWPAVAIPPMAIVVMVIGYVRKDGLTGFGGPVPAGFGSPTHVAELLLGKYLMAFELISIVLLVAIIGALAIGKDERKLPWK